MKSIAIVVCVIAAMSVGTVSALIVGRADAAHPAQAASACQNVQLLIRANGSNGAAGHVAVSYRMHNVSGRACTLYGYPGVQLLDRHFATLPTTVQRGGMMITSGAPRSVTVAGHGNAFFTLVYSDVPVGNRPCQAPAQYVMIWPPNDVLPVVTYAFPHGSMPSCTGAIEVSAVIAQQHL